MGHIIKDSVRRIVLLKLTIDRHEGSRTSLLQQRYFLYSNLIGLKLRPCNAGDRLVFATILRSVLESYVALPVSLSLVTSYSYCVLLLTLIDIAKQ